MFLSAQFCTPLSTFLCQFKYDQASVILKYIKEKLLPIIILYELLPCLHPSHTTCLRKPSFHVLSIFSF